MQQAQEIKPFITLNLGEELMKKIIITLLSIVLLLTVSLPAGAQTTSQSIPFSGWSQGEDGNFWEPNAYIPGIGQVVLCQTADDLSAYLQAGEYPLDYAETYGHDEAFLPRKVCSCSKLVPVAPATFGM